MREMTKEKITLIAISLITTIALIYGLLFATSCSWQGHRHIVTDPNGIQTKAEAWSMRFLWVSSGLEAYDSTPYWTAGIMANKSQTDPNSVKSVTAGVVQGLKEI